MAAKESIMTILLAALVIVSAVQAVQLIGLSSSLSSGTVTVKASAPKAAASSGGSSGVSAPVAANLPSMVGGC
ncbi:MAG TPA: hypothetical protein VI968_01070 [archaeon]|nr:hypothetical protein [archaeon]